MTENEAKAIVHEIAMNYAENGEEEYCEALDIAIKALEEVPQQEEIKSLADETVRELGKTRNTIAKWNFDKLTESNRKTIGRMIDADELIDVLKVRAANEIVHGYMTAYDVTNSIIDEVKKQPTVYDPNWVVEQLNTCLQRTLDTLEYEVLHGSVEDRISEAAKVEAFQEAIKIVKDGGTDEEKRHIGTEKKNDKE